jgi:selenocysteine-specific elongation factor
MHVVATAGHVDHGKSALIRALTGIEPDRWEEERRRGMTIGLGYAWTRLPVAGGEVEVAFVDVPGHERFVPTMLAGVGPVPAALFVVAATEGWRPQSEEHLAALDAMGVRRGVLAVTHADLADPGPAMAAAAARLARSSLGAIDAVAVSSVTGLGLTELRHALARMVGRLPAPPPDASVRLWVDRSFTVAGAGTVVTGTLPAGRIAPGDTLQVGSSGRLVTVRGLQCLGRQVTAATGVSRVAVNLRGVERQALARGDALHTPDAWCRTRSADVRLHGADPASAHWSALVLHIGSSESAVSSRPLGPGLARLRWKRPLPLHVGDVGLLRDPGAHRIVGRVVVLDPDPPELVRRGDGARRATALAGATGTPDPAAELARRGVVSAGRLAALGVPAPDLAPLGGWFVEPELRERLARRLPDEVARHRREHPLEPGLPIETARQLLELPDARLVAALLRPPLHVIDGRVTDLAGGVAVPDSLQGKVERLLADLDERPFLAPEAARISDLGLSRQELAVAERAGLISIIGDGIVLGPEALKLAAERLRALPAPFTLSQARQALGTTRRVAVPLLERMDREHLTVREGDCRRLR